MYRFSIKFFIMMCSACVHERFDTPPYFNYFPRHSAPMLCECQRVFRSILLFNVRFILVSDLIVQYRYGLNCLLLEMNITLGDAHLANVTHAEILIICQDSVTNSVLTALCNNYLRKYGPLDPVDDTSPKTLGQHRPSAPLVWGFGLFFVTLISLCALVGIGIMRLLKKSTFNRFLIFISVAYLVYLGSSPSSSALELDH